MYERDPWTTLTMPRQSFLGDPTPSVTSVQLADGSTYVIPSGTMGSFAWARQANLVAKAYDQVGDAAKALQWQREYDKRVVAWSSIQAGLDATMVVASQSWLEAPARILAKTVSDLMVATGTAATGLAALPGWLPVIALGLLGVAALGFGSGNLRIRR